MKIQIEVVDKVNKDDLLIWDGKKFVPFNKEKIQRPIRLLEHRIKMLTREIEVLKLQLRLDHGEITKEQFDKEIGRL